MVRLETKYKKSVPRQYIKIYIPVWLDQKLVSV